MPWKHVRKNVLENYAFDYTKKMASLILGNGMIYNHSSDSNVEHVWRDDDEIVVEFIASCTIKKGEELCIDYGENYWI